MSLPLSTFLATSKPAGAGPHLVLLGAGHAHVHVLKAWARRPVPGASLTLVSPYPRSFYSGMVPGFIAGHYILGQCEIGVPPLVSLAGAQWQPHHATGIDTKQKRVMLSNGQSLAYDVLSIDTGADTDHHALQTQMPGALEHGVFVRPLEHLAQRWEEIAQSASAQEARLVVVGGGAAGFELACALRARFNSATISLVTGKAGLAKSYAMGTRRRMQAALAERLVQVFEDDCIGMDANTVFLASGREVPSTQTWLATGSRAPTWLRATALHLDAQGYLAVNQYQQSTSHSEVFGAGDVATRIDRAHPRSGVYAVRAGPALAVNLSIALRALQPNLVNAEPLVPHHLPRYTLNLLSCGNQTAIASYGSWSAQGAWIWLFKDAIDRRFMRRYAVTSKLDHA